MRGCDKTPSPDKALRNSGRERSPWTAQRVRKKGRSSPDILVHLPDLSELNSDEETQGLRSQSSIPTGSIQEDENPFLNQRTIPNPQDLLAARASFDINPGHEPPFSRLFGMETSSSNVNPFDPKFTFAAGRPREELSDDDSSDFSKDGDEAEEGPHTPASDTSEGLPEGKFLADKQHGLLLLQRTPLRELGRNNDNIPDTPPPDVPAPGIRNHAHGKAPPKVPSSCRTIRRVLVDSPPTNASSRRSSWRGEKTRENSPFRPHTHEGMLGILHHTGTPAGSTARRRPLTASLQDMSVDSPIANEVGSKHESETCTDSSPENGPGFVLSKGRVTPNNLVPSWDEEFRSKQESRGHSASQTPPAIHKQTHTAVSEESNMDGQQAWQDVRSGTIQPDDIDTLNALLKAYCKVNGDPEEAEQVIKDACQGGRITPNASTYHHMATLWTQHDQINNEH